MRNCIFCFGPATTKEDAWPLWLVRRITSPFGVTVEAERDGVKLAAWRALRPEQKIRCVCQPCNNHWMSDLENRAKPKLNVCSMSLPLGYHLASKQY
jgi:hypothetical protein